MIAHQVDNDFMMCDFKHILAVVNGHSTSLMALHIILFSTDPDETVNNKLYTNAYTSGFSMHL